MFEGQLILRIKNFASSDPGCNNASDKAYFTHKLRKFQSVVQGRFKETVRVRDVLAGHEASRPVKNLPPPFIVKAGQVFIRQMMPGVEFSLHCDQPYLMNIMAGNCQVMRADIPGNEPDIRCYDIQEDCTLFGGAFAKGNVSKWRRRRIFNDETKGGEYTFNTDTGMFPRV